MTVAAVIPTPVADVPSGFMAMADAGVGRYFGCGLAGAETAGTPMLPMLLGRTLGASNKT